jgi:precorrin-6Y C5,15-methyltransferase (decarboxylating)
MPGELLWDIGSGSGSIGIEWLRAGSLLNGTPCKAIGFEKNQTRLERAKKNAADLGVPQLELVLGKAEEKILTALNPDAIFIGGGITTQGLLENALNALKPGGRLVANTVTIEGAAKLIEFYKEKGGHLSQIAMSNADPVGHFHGMRPQMTITQWVYKKNR